MANEIVKNNIHVFKSTHPTAALDTMTVNDHNKTVKFDFRGSPTDDDETLMGIMLQKMAGKESEKLPPNQLLLGE